MPAFTAAEAAWAEAPDMDEDCTDNCGECKECLAIAAETEAANLADSERKGDWA